MNIMIIVYYEYWFCDGGTKVDGGLLNLELFF